MANYLKAWREHAHINQDELADRVGTTKSVVSLLENGHRSLSDKWLRKFAAALDTTPGHILDTDPNNLDSDILDIWVRLSKEDRGQAARILRTFLKDGTSG